MNTREKISADKLIAFMKKHGLNRRQVAEATYTKMRSVSRWKITGIPAAEWELLQKKIK